jgi:lipid-binding SYLF domain-containing protein
MKLHILATATTTLLATTTPLLAYGEEVMIDRSSSAFKEAHTSLTRATEVYREISAAKDRHIPQSVLNSTKCVAIFPDTVTISAGIGGIHSDGVAFCKTAAGTWQNPMFLNLTGGSLGLQAGVKSADMVLYITGEKAAEALKQGTFQVGGELSAVAGTFDKTAEAPTAQVVAYQKSEGLFAGASVDGVRISRDDSDERAFYGSRESALTATIPHDLQNQVNTLKNELPPNVG